MRIRFFFYLVLIFAGFLSPNRTFSQNTELQLANEKYRQQDYMAASEKYEKLIADGFQSKALYYNLGNTYFRLGENGKSVLNYERALLLAPNDKEIQENLAFVKSQLKDEIIALEVFPLITFWRNVRNSLSVGVWTWMAVVLFWAGFAGLVIWILAPVRKQRVKGFFGGITILVICSLPILMAFGRKLQIQSPNKAVVLQDGLNLQATPATGSETLYVLFEGATVSTLESLEEWEKVSLANGYQGWVERASLAYVK